jgi:hypothetical protein
MNSPTTKGIAMTAVQVTFHLETINITTVVYVDNLEVESNINNKAIAQARVRLLQEYDIDVESLGYESISLNEEGTISL